MSLQVQLCQNPGKKSSAHLKVLSILTKCGLNMAYVVYCCLEKSVCKDLVKYKLILMKTQQKCRQLK